ncbi:RNA 2',3'-cyclic phosphodiesterase [Aggregatilinea lenta]|uniref:RNA 2',3'-cyclic phosphodiesterase n=1 Tax=Aggregatilinea lenta TaxID=913108 RepID=UPI000E5B14FB|nr:RNA 2',3'-cyclic phosphodiesterase [Aggregatilinea lenta]
MSSDKWRLFIAIELPDSVLDTLTYIQSGLKQRAPAHTVRWVAPGSIHLTLKFLGDVPVAQLDDIRAALDHAARGHGPFELSIGSLGCFPNTARPRVIWIGLERNPSALGALRDAVEAQIAPLGYPTEDRPFSPHLTLGRIRQEAPRNSAAAMGKLIDATPTSTRDTWTVGRVSLMRSELAPGGPIYTEIGSAALHPHD